MYRDRVTHEGRSPVPRERPHVEDPGLEEFVLLLVGVPDSHDGLNLAVYRELEIPFFEVLECEQGDDSGSPDDSFQVSFANRLGDGGCGGVGDGSMLAAAETFDGLLHGFMHLFR